MLLRKGRNPAKVTITRVFGLTPPSFFIYILGVFYIFYCFLLGPFLFCYLRKGHSSAPTLRRSLSQGVFWPDSTSSFLFVKYTLGVFYIFYCFLLINWTPKGPQNILFLENWTPKDPKWTPKGPLIFTISGILNFLLKKANPHKFKKVYF